MRQFPPVPWRSFIARSADAVLCFFACVSAKPLHCWGPLLGGADVHEPAHTWASRQRWRSLSTPRQLIGRWAAGAPGVACSLTLRQRAWRTRFKNSLKTRVHHPATPRSARPAGAHAEHVAGLRSVAMRTLPCFAQSVRETNERPK